MSYFSRISQAVTSDPNNSSSGNLASSFTFTGSGSSTLGVAGIQVSLKTDQNCLIYIDQSPDNINWDLTDTYNYYASINNFGVTVQAISSYVRIRVKNTGTSSTTYFRLQTALCPIVESVPRSLDSNGNFKVAIKSSVDEYGFASENTPFGEMRTITPTRLVGSHIEGNVIDSNFWVITTSNSATGAMSSGEVIMSSGISASGSIQLYSLRRSRYVSGNAMKATAILQISDLGAANNTRKFGVAYGETMPNITDGAYFQLNGTTFGVVLLKNGVPTTINSGSFNGVLGSVYSPGTSAVRYEIYWTNLDVYFVIGGSILHHFSATTTTWSSTNDFYIYASNANSGNTTNVSLKTRAAGIFRLGPLLTQPTSKYQSGITTSVSPSGVICKYGSGNLHGISISGIINGSIVTLYDNVNSSGSVLWSSGVMTIGTGPNVNNLPYYIDFKGLPFFIGLTLVISAANSNVTIIYE